MLSVETQKLAGIGADEIHGCAALTMAKQSAEIRGNSFHGVEIVSIFILHLHF